MTEPRITDAYIAKQLALAEKATPVERSPSGALAYVDGNVHFVQVGRPDMPPYPIDDEFLLAARTGYPAVLRALAEALAQVKVLREALVKAEEDMIWMFGAWDGSSADEETARPHAHANIAALHAALAAAPVEEVKDA